MIEEILNTYYGEDILIADGFNDAIIGIEDDSLRIIYSVKKCVDILMSEGIAFDEALEYFDFNVKGSYMGDKTPIWCYDLFGE
jgi:hypothetical protein